MRAPRLVDLVVGTVLAALLAEAVVRVVQPTPRAQVIRDTARSERYRLLDVPMWRDRSVLADPIRGDDCVAAHPDARRIGIVGDSVVFVTSGDIANNFSVQVRDVLPEGELCTLNVGQPGYIGPQKWATATDLVERVQPEWILWQAWADGGVIAELGDTWYLLKGFEQDEEGYPRSFLPIPDVANRFLLRSSSAWELMVLAANADRTTDEDGDAWIRRFEAEARPKGTRLALMFFPILDRPFAQRVEGNEQQRRLTAWAKEHDVPTFSVAEHLIDEDYMALRLDPCCHYNDAGHAALARAMRPWITSLLEETE